MTHLLRAGLLGLGLLLTALPAAAGAIFFNLSLTKDRLTVSNLGNSSAFYPAAYRLLANGQWEALQALPRQRTAAELASNAQITFLWPALPAKDGKTTPAALQPVMVRFFDQAGAGFGQISFFQQPPPVSAPLESFYHDGQLVIVPPATPRTTWLLWAQEEGIAPLQQAVDFTHRQPDAQRITWHAGDRPKAFDLGRGQPAAMLLHETAQGFELQVLSSGGRQGREQRAAWLDASPGLYIVAGGALGLAFLLLLWHAVQARRQRRAGQ